MNGVWPTRRDCCPWWCDGDGIAWRHRRDGALLSDPFDDGITETAFQASQCRALAAQAITVDAVTTGETGNLAGRYCAAVGFTAAGLASTVTLTTALSGGYASRAMWIWRCASSDGCKIDPRWEPLLRLPSGPSAEDGSGGLVGVLRAMFTPVAKALAR